MKTRLYFVAGAASFMVAGAAAGSYATILAMHSATDGETTLALGWSLGRTIIKTKNKILFGK